MRSVHNAMHVAVHQLMAVVGVQDICAVKFYCLVPWNCSWVPLTSLISGHTCAQSWILMHKAWPESTVHSFSSFWFYLWDFKLLDEPLPFTRPLCLGSKQLHSYLSQRIFFSFEGVAVSLSKLGFTRQLSPTRKWFEIFSQFSQDGTKLMPFSCIG